MNEISPDLLLSCERTSLPHDYHPKVRTLWVGSRPYGRTGGVVGPPTFENPFL